MRGGAFRLKERIMYGINRITPNEGARQWVSLLGVVVGHESQDTRSAVEIFLSKKFPFM